MEVLGFLTGIGFLLAAAVLSWRASFLEPTSFWRACLAILSAACTMAPIVTVSGVLVRLVLGKGLSKQFYLSQKRTQARCGLPVGPASMSMHGDHHTPVSPAGPHSAPPQPTGPASSEPAPQRAQQQQQRRQHMPIAPLIAHHVPMLDNIV
jgi:hypothetical protein